MCDTQFVLHGNRLFLPDRPIPCDAVIALGMNRPERPALCAAALYHRGLAPRLILSGGDNPRLGGTECARMLAAARRAGVPDEALIAEPSARHTDENAEFSVRLLPPDCRAVMVVTLEVHMTRALLAMRRWLTPQIALGWSAYPSLDYSAADWAATKSGQAAVASEIEKIRRYYGVSAEAIGALGFAGAARAPQSTA